MGSVSEGLEETLAALADLLGPEDAALVALARGLAAAVEDAPSAPGSGALWKEYRAALTQLREVGSGGDDDTAEFLNSVRAPVGNGAVS